MKHLNKRSTKTLFAVILFVYADIMCENALVMVNDQQKHFFAAILLFGFLTLQIIFAPLQAGFSDFYGRKKSLIISISISLISLIVALVYTQNILAIFSLVILATAIKGIWGNTIPIAYAAVADVQDKNYRGSFAIVSSTFALSYLTLMGVGSLNLNIIILIYVIVFALIVSMLVCLFNFNDPEDKTAHLPYKFDFHKIKTIMPLFWKIGKKEAILLKTDLTTPLIRKALSSYLLWEVSMYSILISEIDFNVGKSRNFIFAMMFGYLVGVFILKLKFCEKISDSKIITWGYFISFFSLIPYFILFKIVDNTGLLLGICYFMHALGNAFLSPTILSILVKNKPPHDQGKVLGLVESSDSAAFLLSTLAVILFKSFNFPIYYLIFFSFVSFSISWIYYKILSNPTLTSSR